MASQEFLASFGVEIDEAGVSRLQTILEENRKLADDLAASFEAASTAIHTLAEDLGTLPGFGGMAEEGFSGFGGLALGLDLSAAQKDLDAFLAQMKKPVKLSANTSAIVSAGRSAYESVRSIFSSPVIITAKTQVQDSGTPGGNDTPTRQKMSTGGRFTRPTDVQVAEDGDAEYIIPVKKEDRALPLLRQLLGELSPGARESLAGSVGSLSFGDMSAGIASMPSVTQNNSNISAPVNIHVQASGMSAEAVGERIYDTAERYLLRTLKGVTA